MAVNENKERIVDAKVVVASGEQPVQIVDRGEDFENGKGRIPDHEKIDLVYPSQN